MHGIVLTRMASQCFADQIVSLPLEVPVGEHVPFKVHNTMILAVRAI